MEHGTRTKYHFPWQAGNRFTLLCDGDQFFPRMLAAIDGARHHILLEMYLFESGRVADRFIQSLAPAAGRGVAVYLLLDSFGARGLNPHDRERLAQAGVVLKFYNPLFSGELRRNLFRDHRKLLVVDGETAFTGGVGITDAFDPPTQPPWRWRETVIEVHGPCVGDWQTLFVENWRHWGERWGERQGEGPSSLSRPQPAPSPHTGSPGQSGRVVANQPSRLEIKRSFLKRVRGAERRVWMSTAYFVPSWKLRRALRHAAHQGADVRLLLPGPHTDHPAVRHAGRRFYARLLRHGIRIYEYQPRFLHTKLLLCDDWASLGSSNVDRWNLRWNLEANQEVEDSTFASEVQAVFAGDFADSREIHYEQWRRRSWHRRFLEWFWGRVDIWLEKRR